MLYTNLRVGYRSRQFCDRWGETPSRLYIIGLLWLHRGLYMRIMLFIQGSALCLLVLGIDIFGGRCYIQIS